MDEEEEEKKAGWNEMNQSLIEQGADNVPGSPAKGGLSLSFVEDFSEDLKELEEVDKLIIDDQTKDTDAKVFIAWARILEDSIGDGYSVT